MLRLSPYLYFLIALASLAISAALYLNALDMYREMRMGSVLHINGTPLNGKLELSPSNSDISLQSLQINFAADTNIPKQQLLPGQHSIALKAYEENLKRRFNELEMGIESDSAGFIDYVPVLITANYWYHGRHLTSQGAYYIFYLISGENKMESGIEPSGLLFCKEISNSEQKIDFVVDMRYKTSIGYKEKPSNAVAFGCGSKRV